MQYFSTNQISPRATFREAVLKGQPDDKGLYFPDEIPILDLDFINKLDTFSSEEIAFQVIKPYVGDSITEEALFNICRETVNFPFPVVKIGENVSALELFHGPTLAFKDVGARFMSRCLQHFARGNNTKTIVIVATSGDTGGAVANGFYGVDGVEVVILYPKGKVSKVQELQLTTLGANVTTLELQGSFDDCQWLAKTALGDAELQKTALITSANSINVARWLPQQFYYFYALKNWQGEPPVISVPSGNFGNICAGILAGLSGLPVRKFIAACNENDVVPRYFESGDYEPRASISTLSNAMDVGNPSNFVRILQMFDGQLANLKEQIKAIRISDSETKSTMADVYEQCNYVLDPHGAVAYCALNNYLADGEKGIFLETAHPVKFESVKTIVGTYGDVPKSIESLLLLEKQSIEINNDYGQLRDILLTKV